MNKHCTWRIRYDTHSLQQRILDAHLQHGCRRVKPNVMDDLHCPAVKPYLGTQLQNAHCATAMPFALVERVALCPLKLPWAAHLMSVLSRH